MARKSRIDREEERERRKAEAFLRRNIRAYLQRFHPDAFWEADTIAVTPYRGGGGKDALTFDGPCTYPDDEDGP